jgi:aspartyl-tRNA(Asn)/glutamyl-tRNA(Gln) amidotransferase subunit A
MSLNKLTAEKVKEGLKAKKFSAVEVAKIYIDSAAASNPKSNAYITLTPEVALEQAKVVDARIAKGEELRLLEGVPVAVKDLFCTKGVRSTAASKMLENFV